jgi:hypothetical protein
MMEINVKFKPSMVIYWGDGIVAIMIIPTY